MAFGSTGGRVMPLLSGPEASILGDYARLKISDTPASPPRAATSGLKLPALLSPSTPLEYGTYSPQASPLKKSKTASLQAAPCVTR